MAVMVCTHCHEALPLPRSTSGPVEIGCPRCGAVYSWPPRGSDAKAKPLGVRPGAAAPVAGGRTLPAVLTVEPCPSCARPLRLPVERAGQLATCPRSDCGHVFRFAPRHVGQEIETIEAMCSVHADGGFSIVFERPQGSGGVFNFRETQRGRGAMDRLALDQHEHLSETGTVSYNRNWRATHRDLLNFYGCRCPWCASEDFALCSDCGTVICQGAMDGGLITCPGCNEDFRISQKQMASTVLTRGGSYTPKATPTLDNRTRAAPALADDRGQYLPASIRNFLRLGRKG